MLTARLDTHENRCLHAAVGAAIEADEVPFHVRQFRRSCPAALPQFAERDVYFDPVPVRGSVGRGAELIEIERTIGVKVLPDGIFGQSAVVGELAIGCPQLYFDFDTFVGRSLQMVKSQRGVLPRAA